MYSGILKCEEWVFWLVTNRWIDDNEIRLAVLTSASRFHTIFNRWKSHFYSCLHVLGVDDTRQTEIHIAELLIPEPGA